MCWPVKRAKVRKKSSSECWLGDPDVVAALVVSRCGEASLSLDGIMFANSFSVEERVCMLGVYAYVLCLWEKL